MATRRDDIFGGDDIFGQKSGTSVPALPEVPSFPTLPSPTPPTGTDFTAVRPPSTTPRNPTNEPVSGAYGVVGTDPGYQEKLAAWFQQYLGRAPEAPDYAANYGSPSYQSLLQSIINSDEAKARQTAVANAPFNQGALMQFLEQFPHTPEGLAAAYAQNPGAFGGATILGKDKLKLPDGTVVDIIRGAYPGGGEAWQWLTEPAGGSSAALGLGNYFNDPTQQFAVGGVQQRLQGIEQALGSQPGLGAIPGLTQQAIDQWSGPQQMPGATQSILQQIAEMFSGARPQNAQLQQSVEGLRSRISELRQAPFSAGEDAALRAAAFDQLEQDRSAAKQRVLEQLGGMGHAPTSGIVARALQEVDQQYDQFRAQNTNQLAMYGIQLKDQRGAQADALEQSLSAMGGIDQQAEMAWKQAQVQAGLSASEVEVGWQQEVQRRLAAANAMAQMLYGVQMTQWGAGQGLQQEAQGLSQIPFQLMLQSLAAANGVYAGQPNAGTVLGGYGNLSGLASNQQQYNNANWGNYLGGMGTLLGTILGQRGLTGGAGGGDGAASRSGDWY